MFLLDNAISNLSWEETAAHAVRYVQFYDTPPALARLHGSLQEAGVGVEVPLPLAHHLTHVHRRLLEKAEEERWGDSNGAPSSGDCVGTIDIVSLVPRTQPQYFLSLAV